MGRAYEVRKRSIAKTSQAKSKVYSRYGREIYLAAKQGLPDPNLNTELKRVIDEAKKNQVPNDIINRAIDKVKQGTDENYEKYTYEVFGPNNSLILVETLTDNHNRTMSDIRKVVNKTKSKLGESGSISHMFVKQSVFKIKDLSEDDLLEILIENELDIEKSEMEEDGLLIIADPKNYFNIKTAIETFNKNLEFLVDTITWIPFTYMSLDKESLEEFNKIIDQLEDLDDTQKIYHNVDNIE